MNCKICDGATSAFGRLRLLGKYDATYHHCTHCGFLFVQDPTWLAEAYSDAIADIDLGPIERMVQYSRRVKLTLHYFLDSAGACLDYGAGYGLLVRRMRDMGYDFRWHDKYCDNLFAKDFVGSLDSHYQLITAFEVLEHLTDPLVELDQWSRSADNILVSTLLIGRDPPPLGNWPYYAPETGQHIGFFTVDTMQHIAERLGLHFASDGIDFHLFSKKPVDRRFFRYAMNHRAGRILNAFVARPSLLPRDVTNVRKAETERLANLSRH